MDLTKYRAKLIGSEEERAVSPVIGVILMVAITVILAAVIAAFVLDLGDDMGEGSVNAGVSADVSDADNEVTVTVDDKGDAEKFVLRGEGVDGDEVELSDLENTGDTVTLTDGTELDGSSGDVNIIAVSGDSETNVGGFEWDWDPDVTIEIDDSNNNITVTADYTAEHDNLTVSANGATTDTDLEEGEFVEYNADDGDIDTEGSGKITADSDTIDEFNWDFS